MCKGAAHQAEVYTAMGMPEYALLVEAAFTIPQAMYDILRDPNSKGTYGLERAQLGQQLVDLGLAFRVVANALWDDKLIDVCSVLQLSVMMPRQFLAGMNTALALEQAIEGIVAHLKEQAKHLYWGASVVTQMLQHRWAAQLSEAMHEGSLDARVASSAQYHADSAAEHEAFFKLACVLVDYDRTAYRFQLASDLTTAAKALRRAGATEAIKAQQRLDINHLLGNGDAERKHTQIWDVWSYNPDVTRRETVPSPYAALSVLTAASPVAAVRAIEAAADAELELLRALRLQPGIENMLGKKSLSQLVRDGSSLNTGIQPAKFLKVHGSMVKTPSVLTEAKPTRDGVAASLGATAPGEAVAWEASVAKALEAAMAEYLHQEPIQKAFGQEYLDLESSLLRAARRGMVRLDQEARAQFDTESNEPVAADAAAAAVFMAITLEPDGTRVLTGTLEKERTAAFFFDSEADDYRVGRVLVPEDEAPPAGPQTYQIRPLTVLSSAVLGGTSYGRSSRRGAARAMQKSIYEPPRFQHTPEMPALLVPARKITHMCRFRLHTETDVAIIPVAEQATALDRWARTWSGLRTRSGLRRWWRHRSWRQRGLPQPQRSTH
jgi:hypothetical protein